MPRTDKLKNASRIQAIELAVCDEYGVDVGQFRCGRRYRLPELTHARAVFGVLARDLTGESYPRIALALGFTRHSTIREWEQRGRGLVLTPDHRDRVARILQAIGDQQATEVTA